MILSNTQMIPRESPVRIGGEIDYNRRSLAARFLRMAAKHLHILGICGTFMGGVAALAKAAGYRVTGCDANVYPPMSDQLQALGIELIEGYSADQRSLRPDIWVVGNVVSRGNPLMEAILDQGDPYTSGPQWLSEHILSGKWVLAVAGTHGKTTTSAMLAWVLEKAGLEPGFLIGGVPRNFSVSARHTDAPFFVIEADEYDTAFFDKRSKFVHYRPKTAILNNLEFDHADIFPDIAAIERQFHHLVRIVPSSGRLVVNGTEPALGRVLDMGKWSIWRRDRLVRGIPRHRWQLRGVQRRAVPWPPALGAAGRAQSIERTRRDSRSGPCWRGARKGNRSAWRLHERKAENGVARCGRWGLRL